jgi:ketosteroid isomerase-like protein
MNTRVAIAAVCVPLLLGFTGQAANMKDAPSKEVNATFDRYIAGWNKGDLNLLSSVYASDARLTAFWPDPYRPSRLESWATIKSNLKDIFEQIQGLDLEFNEREIDFYGSCAVLTSHWTWHDPANPLFAHGRATFVFRRDGNKWLVVHEHSSVLPFIPSGDEPAQPPAGASR